MKQSGPEYTRGRTLFGRRRTLRSRIVLVLLLAAFLPLVLSSFGSWIVFGRLIERKSVELMRTAVESHAHAIDAYLSENLHLLQITAEAYPLLEMSQSQRIQTLFNNLNASSDGTFIDLGIIDDRGNHLAYVGPYDLHHKNYREADWFKEVTLSGAYISDVFLGFRQVPHCVIAVKTSEAGRPIILRATINSEYFDRLVKTVSLSEGSTAYILNREGLYQTSPARGSVLDRAAISDLTYYTGLREQRATAGGERLVRVTTWINHNRWMLVVEQNLAAIRAPVNQAIAAGASVVVVAILLLVATTFLATRHLTRRIDKATAEREEMSRAFLRSAKLASIGELSTGLAHEINNPLAIISAEQTNIQDLFKELPCDDQSRHEILESIERCQSQVQRCASITRKMLQFGRKKDTNLELTDVGSRLLEISGFLQRRAAVHNIQIVHTIQDDLPQAFVDPIELEQVLVNLINNAFDALPNGGTVELKAFREDAQLHIEVRDTGTGISPADLDYIFEPFFTTKDVGKGTGLGLSVCYGIIESWGGVIKAQSDIGKGTTIHIFLPLQSRNERGSRA